MYESYLNNIKFWQSRTLPVLLQAEAAECGLACLAMVCSFWGYKTDLASMRRRFSVSLKGVTLKTLMTMSSAIGMNVRPLRLDLDQLNQLKLPCILHWDMNHFVVLKSVSGRSLMIHDPAVGERQLVISEFSKHFTGIALEIVPGAGFKKGTELQQFSLFSLMGRVVGLKRGLLHFLLLGLALQVCSLLAPFYMQWLVDDAILTADRNMVTVLGVGFLLLVVLQTSISGVRSWVITVISTNLNIQWQGNTFSHLMALPLRYFENRHIGDVVSRFSSIQEMQRALTTKFVEAIIDGLLVISTWILLVVYNARLAAVAIVATLMYVAMRWTIFRSLRDATGEQIIHASKQSTHFLESIRGIQSIRLFGRNEERRAGWLNALADQYNADLRIAKLSISYQTVNALIFGAERVIIIWLGALSVLSGQFSIGMLFAFISYKDQFSQRIASLVDKIFDFRMLRVHGERVADIVLTAPEQSNNFELDTTTVAPSVEFRNVCFRYSDGEPHVLDDINLKIEAGECIAVTGASGCGKSTLIKLALGLLEPTSGSILVGGVKLDTLGVSNVREIFATVMQEDGLFSGSIQDNISFFAANMDVELVQRCAMMAAVHTEIVAMPMGYNTLVGDIGSGLSGGQRQRILLARALYKTPKILVLDEATSHLDVMNEHAVNTAIKQLDLTRIIVAHRPETIAMANRVVVLQHGKLIQDSLQITNQAA
ncbi:peptidase domain-containing ABC transporter [Massilia sp. SR12]